MRFAYADPPYMNDAGKYRNHADYAGEVDHAALINQLITEYPDGWVLHLSCKSLQTMLAMCPSDVRVLAWVKPLSGFLPGIRLQYGWEPIIMRGGRQGKHEKGQSAIRDWISQSALGLTFRPREEGYVIGRKPDEVCFWLFDCIGARPGDELNDLFPGSGAVGRAWERFTAQERLAV